MYVCMYVVCVFFVTAEKGGTMKEEEMKVWKMKDLGLQTLKLISSASNQVRSYAVD